MSILTRLLVTLLWVGVANAHEESSSVSVSEVCDGLRGAIYSSTFETNEDPCELSCSYDETTGALLARCRYDYCEACDDNGVCGVREIQVNTIIEHDALHAALDGGVLNIDTYRFCVDYTEGPHSNKMVCSVVDTSAFRSECGSVLTGIPMTTCDTNGCECTASSEPDYSSLYVGFQTLDFGKCYDVIDGQKSASPRLLTTLAGVMAGVTAALMI